MSVICDDCTICSVTGCIRHEQSWEGLHPLHDCGDPDCTPVTHRQRLALEARAALAATPEPVGLPCRYACPAGVHWHTAPATPEGLRTLADLRGFLVEHLPDGQGAILHLFDDAVRSHAMAMRTPAKAEGLDEAWAAAEAALPRGWRVKSVSGRFYPVSRLPSHYVADYQDGHGWWRGAVEGPTPAAALRALAARLADTATEGEDREAARVARDSAWTPLRQDTPAKAEGLDREQIARAIHGALAACDHERPTMRPWQCRAIADAVIAATEGEDR